MKKISKTSRRFLNSRVGHVHTTLEARVKVTLSTSSGEDLRLDDDLLSILLKLVGEVVGLVGRTGVLAERSRNSVL